ncbi:MAG: hypothetical protein CMO55_22250 [Verrucomicrobiales bacterium]|nr:hypothetical protein [Verrucomicrobiales bacterium]
MFPNYIGLSAVLLTVLVFFLTDNMVRRLGGLRQVGITAVLILLAVPGASFSAYYLHLFPESEWYYEFRSWRGTEFLVVFIGAAGGAVGALVNPVVKYIVFAMVFFAAYAPFCKPIVAPLPKDAFANVEEDGIWQQSTPSTCGPASTATVLSLFGKNITEKEVARRAYSYRGGTEAWYLARVIRDEGLKAEFRFGEGFEPEFSYPAITGVTVGGIGHFIVIFGPEGDDFVIADPLKGREVISPKQLKERYLFTGFNLQVKQLAPSS